MRFANELRRAHFVVALFAIASTELLVASSASGQPDGFRVVGPPPEMVDACKGSSAGDDCTVALKGHTMNGTCRAGPTADAPLACVPKEPPPGMSAKLDACNGRVAGDSCSLIFGDRTIDGTCGADPYRDGQLICRPVKQKP